MINDQLQRILVIVDTALSLEPNKRPGYLTKVCGNDEELRKEVLKLLESIDKSETFWEDWQQWNDQQVLELLQEPIGETQAPERIGPWKPIKLLGEGGMGIVYLSERADGHYKQKAAVKLLHRGLEFSESVHRFEQERQILAKLDHPNIAGFYDGGITENGWPWLAMQYVGGTPITNWCKKNNTSLQQRLELFQKVCEAVRYAHLNLVVHRDLKPENILVTKDRAVKVLDFGIAKLLDEELSGTQHIQTQTGLRVMSLDYAAPEQITGESITTATDVYALGLLLYELLTETYPFEIEGKNQRQIEQILRNQDPAKPSSKITEWRAKLRDDLDAITLKALRKEPEHRYENAGQLLDDIKNYHSILPVVARGDTLRYRVGKFYKRHRGKLTAAMIVLVGIITLVSYYTYQITEERNQARQEAAKAEEISSFLQNLFDAADPNIVQGKEITAREMVNIGVERIEKELSNQPVLQAQLFDVISPIYNRLGLYDKSLEIAQKSLQIKKSVPQLNDKEIAKSFNSIGTSFTYSGKYDSAAKYFKRILSAQGQIGAVSEEKASALHSLGAINYYQMHYKSADSLYNLALTMRKNIYGEEHEKVAQTMSALGVLYGIQDSLQKAEELNSKALKIREKILRTDHPDIANSKNSLGVLYLNQGKIDKAIPLLIEVVEMRKKIYGEEHPSVANSLNNLGAAYKQSGEYEKAVINYIKALDIRQKVLESTHPDLGYTNCSLALAHYDNGYKEKALPLFKTCLKIFEQSLRPTHGLIIKSKGLIGDCLVEQERYQEAESILLEVYKSGAAEYGEDHNEIKRLKSFLANLYIKWDKPEQAAKFKL